MRIPSDDVKKVASLSRLYFAEDEIDAFADDLGAVVEHAKKLNELDTSNVRPTAHILPVKNVFREDNVRPSMDRELLTANAPEKEDGCFIVPKVVE